MSHPFQLEHYPCAVCESTVYRKKYHVKGFHIVQCTACSFIYVNPRVKNEFLYTLYTSNYFNNILVGYENYELTAHLRIKTFQRWLRIIESFLRDKGAVLDIGCASGYFLELLKDKGWQVEGIELDQHMAKKLKEKQLPVFEQPFELYTSHKKFKLITLFDVLEHLPRLH